MGENFLKRQVRNFKKGRDLALVGLNDRTLFVRPDVVSTIYTALPNPNCDFKVGETLFVIAWGEGERAILARGHREVGRIEGDGVKVLLAALTETGAAGIAQVRIVEVSGLSGNAKVVIEKE